MQNSARERCVSGCAHELAEVGEPCVVEGEEWVDCDPSTPVECGGDLAGELLVKVTREKNPTCVEQGKCDIWEKHGSEREGSSWLVSEFSVRM